MSAQNTGSSLPLLTPADRTKFTRIFVGCGPQNGLVSGDKARDVFVKSKLDYEKLGQIW
jgi:epidermal growth factor receptor substrate 15